MTPYETLIARDVPISIIGLGYVGLPLAIAFAETLDVVGFDLNAAKIDLYRQGIDPTREVGDEAVKTTSVQFTADETRLRDAKFHIVAVPTPINADKTPDLSPVVQASRILGRNLTRGSVVVYESTVYPGVTEDVCVPILETESGLKCGPDFGIGYSPERINPGDRVHTLKTIQKIVSGMDESTLDQIAKIYELVIDAGVHRACSIKVAEAAKVVENSQRDINIAFMNELAMVFDRMDIDTDEVIRAMNTKWNALGFRPGLVGGHCIGVDPYYFVYEAEKLGYHSQIILSGRKINDGMGAFVADAAIKQLALSGKPIKGAKVAILGLTFKEDCPDIRNTRVIDIIERLQEYGISPQVTDAQADPKEALREYNLQLTDLKDLNNLDCLILAVAHKAYKQLSLEDLDHMYAPGAPDTKVLIDVKSLLNKPAIKEKGYRYWSL